MAYVARPRRDNEFLNDHSSPRISLLLKTPIIGLVLILTVYLFTILFAPLRIIDDAYISFRYASNLRLHHELSFNIGERVEGITNLLWTLLLSITNRDIVTWALAMSIFTNIWTIFRIWQLGVASLISHIGIIFIAILLAVNTQFILATTNGLEAGLYSALLCEACFQLSKGKRYTPAWLLGLLFVTRPDGITSFPGFLVALYLLERRWKLCVGPVIALSALPVAVTIFRLSYYHDWIPNSVTAKAYPLNEFPALIYFGFRYILGFLETSGYWLVFPAMALRTSLSSWLSLSRERQAVLVFSAITLLSSFAVVVRNGGDWMPNYRLLAQYMPLMACISIIMIERMRIDNWTMGLVLLWPLSLTGLSIVNNGGRVGQFSRSGSINDFWNTSATRLSSLAGKDDIISAEAIGYISFHLLDVRMHDPVGLTERHIALHGKPIMLYGKEDSEYTLSAVSPTVALWHYTGHLSSVSSHTLSKYRTWRFGPDAGKMSTIMMIRKDQVVRLSPAVQGWTEIATLAIPR